MGLFDEIEDEPSQGDELFDEKSKIRLFETHQKSSSSIKGYVKKFFPIAVVVLLAIGLVIWLMLPNVGDEVKGPYHLERQLFYKVMDGEKRTPEQMDFYYCGDYYWVRIRVQKRWEDPPVNISAEELARENNRLYRGIGIEKSNDTWETTVSPMTEDRPCNLQR